MNSSLKFVLFGLLALFVASRMTLPKHADISAERGKAFFKPENQNSYEKISTASSYAAPVSGIPNATSGYLSVNDPNTDSKLFYIFYKCRNIQPGQNPNDIPIIIWLQGGAGGSSMAGEFYEMGPWELKVNSSGFYSEVRRAVSWNDYYHMLFIDNPRGTGYSIAGNNSYLTTESEIAEDFLQALLNFYNLSAFQAYNNNLLYFFGESYAGHYIPAIVKTIIKYNQVESNTFKIPLKGIGLGNAWVDPINQMREYSLFAYVLGLADDIQRSYLEYLQLDAYFSILNSNNTNALADWFQMLNYTQVIGGGLNMYDFREFGEYNFTSVPIFMNYNSTCVRYNVDPSVCGSFLLENNNVTYALLGDFMLSYANDVVFALNNGIRVLIYDGQDDIVVNSGNAQDWIDRLDWSGKQAFYNTNIVPWIMNNGSVVGLAKSAQNLTYVIVNKAGHIAAMQQLNSTTEMTARFINNYHNWTAPIPNVI